MAVPWCPLLAYNGASIANPRIKETAWASNSGEKRAEEVTARL